MATPNQNVSHHRPTSPLSNKLLALPRRRPGESVRLDRTFSETNSCFSSKWPPSHLKLAEQNVAIARGIETTARGRAHLNYLSLMLTGG